MGGVFLSLALFSLGSAAFAASYSGDVQLHAGYRHSSVSTSADDDDVARALGFEDLDFELKTNAFEIDIQNWNLFGLREWFSVGFAERLGISMGAVFKPGGAGTAFSFDFAAGPAVGFLVGDVVKFQVGAEFVLGLCVDERVSKGAGNFGLLAPLAAGFALDAQAKFLPDSPASPTVGLRYARTMSRSLKTVANGDFKDIDGETLRGRFVENSISLYLGVTLNLGKK